MGTCVSWLLLLSYAGLAGIGGMGIALTVNNFGSHESGPPIPPAEAILNTTTTTPSSYYDRNSDDRSLVFMEYVHETERYASTKNEPRFFVGVPSGVVVGTATLVLLVGLCSRKLFTTTFSLYSSVGLWVLTLVMQLFFQLNFSYTQDVHWLLPTVGWVVGVHVGLLLLLSLQIVLGMWELRRQKAGWPTINFINLFTLETILLVTRLTAAVYVTIFFIDSGIMNGLRKLVPTYNSYESPVDRYPLWLSLPAAVSLVYTIVAIGEAVFSFFLGIQHIHLAWITCMLSAMCNGFVAVVASPVFVRSYIGQYYYFYSELMIATTIASIVAFIHTLACWFLPSVLRTPPKFVRVAADKLTSLSLSDIFENGIPANYFPFTSDAVQTRASQLRNKMWQNPILMTNFISTVVSVVLIIILGVAWDSPMYRSWGAAILLGVDVAMLCQSFPPLFTQLYYSQTSIVPFAQRVVRHVLELVATFIGSCSIFIMTYHSGLQAAAGLNLSFYIILTWMLMLEHSNRKKATAAGAFAPLSTTQLGEEGEGEAEAGSEGVVGAEPGSGTESESESTTTPLHDVSRKDLVSLA